MLGQMSRTDCAAGHKSTSQEWQRQSSTQTPNRQTHSGQR
jgi:hypothetical protein